MEKNKGQMQDKARNVAWQNKDISSKFLAEEFKDTFFKVYGLKLPSIKRQLPTELPAVEVNDMHMDDFYQLADDSYVIVEFESEYSEANKYKYLGYVARLAKKLYNQTKAKPRIRIVVIYTADVEEGSTVGELDLGDEMLVLTEAFLSKLDADELIRDSEKKIKAGKELADEEKLKLMLCPLAVKGKPGKIKTIHRVIEMAKQIEDAKVQGQILSGMLAFCDKVISREDAEEIRRIIRMTKFEKLIYDEMMEKVNEAVDKAEKRRTEEIAANLLSDGTSVERTSRNTGLEISVVEEIAKRVRGEKIESEPALV